MQPAGSVAPAVVRLRPAPRELPATLRARELFGLPLAFGGWALAGFGMIFVWVFVASADFSGWRYRGSLERAPATVSGCFDTHFSIGGSKNRRGTPVYGNRFTRLETGQRREGVSYATGRCLSEGTAVTVEYPRGRPDLARIVGQRRKPMTPWISFVAIFPGVGLALVWAGYRQGRRHLRLFREGTLGRAKVVASRATRQNKTTVWAMTLSFRDRLGAERRFEIQTTEPAKLQDEPLETVLYDPANPADAVALDALPARLTADPMSGELAGEPVLKLALRLALPAFVVAANVLWALRR